MNTENNILTDEQIDAISEAAESSVSKDVVDMRDIKKETVVDADAELATKMEEVDQQLEMLKNDEITMTDEEREKVLYSVDAQDVVDDSKSSLQLSDDEAIMLVEILNNMKKDKNFPVYKYLPERLKEVVRDIATQNNIPFTSLNIIAKALMEELMSNAGIDKTLIDLQEAMDQILKMPNVSDIYSDHMREVMEVKIPEMIESIKDTEPEKAAILGKIKDRFTESYTFSFAKEQYESNARLRKAIRRYDKEFDRAVTDFNYKASKNSFKMNDANQMVDALRFILITNPRNEVVIYANDNKTADDLPEDLLNLIKLEVEEKDIEKFTIMVLKSTENMDHHSIVDASYMYYLVRNIIALKFTNESKTPFAAELINNVCNTISFIRDKEADFNAANLDKSKQSKKCADK